VKIKDQVCKIPNKLYVGKDEKRKGEAFQTTVGCFTPSHYT
jgi:hypothetical protein